MRLVTTDVELRTMRVTMGRTDLAAVCVARALGEWIGLAIGAQISRGTPSFQRTLERLQHAGNVSDSLRFDAVVARQHMIQLVHSDGSGGWARFTFRADGRLAETLEVSALGSLLEARLPRSYIRSLALQRRRNVRELQLVSPNPSDLPIDSPALACLMELLDGRSRMLDWSPSASPPSMRVHS